MVLYHLLQKRSLVPHFMQIIATTCLLLQMMKQQTFRLFTLAYKVFRALFHSLLPSVLIMSAIWCIFWQMNVLSWCSCHHDGLNIQICLVLLYLYHLSTQYQRKLLMRRQQLLIHLFKAGRQRCRDKVLIRLSLLFTIISLKTVYILLRQTIARVPMVLWLMVRLNVTAAPRRSSGDFEVSASKALL